MLFIDHNQTEEQRGEGFRGGSSAAEEHLALLKFYNFTLNQRRQERATSRRHKS